MLCYYKHMFSMLHQTVHNNRLKLFETKPSYAGLKFVSKLPSHIRNIRPKKKCKGTLKNYLEEQCFYKLPSLY
jgi:hypothetical protein